MPLPDFVVLKKLFPDLYTVLYNELPEDFFENPYDSSAKSSIRKYNNMIADFFLNKADFISLSKFQIIVF